MSDPQFHVDPDHLPRRQIDLGKVGQVQNVWDTGRRACEDRHEFGVGSGIAGPG